MIKSDELTFDRHKGLEKLRVTLFYLICTITLLAELADPFAVDHTIEQSLVNFAVAAIIFVFILLYYFKKVELRLANSVLIYAVFFDLIISSYLRIGDANIESFMLRLTVIILSIIPYAGFTLGEFRVLMLGSVFSINYITIAFLSRDQFLINTLPVVGISLISYVIGVFLLTRHLIKAIEIQTELLKESEEKNKVLQVRKYDLKVANESKDKLFSVISHDMKSPFNNIIGFIDLCQAELESGDTKLISKYLELSKHSSQQAYLLLLNLLDWSVSERSTIQFTPKKLNALSHIKDVEQLIMYDIERKDIALEIDVDAQLLVYADANMFSSIVRNLLNNAIKYTPYGGNINLKCVNTDNYALLEVADNGIGMPKEKMRTLFDNTFNASEPGTENEKGSGLGLSICRDFVKYHEGHITASHNTPKGVKFSVLFPSSK